MTFPIKNPCLLFYVHEYKMSDNKHIMYSHIRIGRSMVIPTRDEIDLIYNHCCKAVGDSTRIALLYAIHEQARNVTALALLNHYRKPSSRRLSPSVSTTSGACNGAAASSRQIWTSRVCVHQFKPHMRWAHSNHKCARPV